QAKAKEYGYEYNWLKKGKVKHDETLADRDELEIIRTYKTIVRMSQKHYLLSQINQTFIIYDGPNVHN
ncbi:MAG: hypothetical protein Q8830_03410, partial [Candidatus Phytoplasma australasiaticum]|nr:hypothetical protein [Candidatus Phytoplasma australasiaticum]